MAFSQRPTRKRIEERVASLRLPVRHSGQCPTCKFTVNLYDDVRGDEIMPSHVSIAVCPKCRAEWIITKL